MTPDMIRQNYPEVLSSEHLRQILGVSKRKVSWLLRNGHIPCQYNGQTTHCYRILRKDLLWYLADREQHPEKYVVPYGIFTTGIPKKGKKALPIVLPPEFMEWLEDEWARLPDVLTADDVCKHTGYAKETILRWKRENRLRFIALPNDVVTTKAWLIAYYGNDGYDPRHLCEKHRKLVKKYLRELEKENQSDESEK